MGLYQNRMLYEGLTEFSSEYPQRIMPSRGTHPSVTLRPSRKRRSAPEGSHLNQRNFSTNLIL